MTNKFKLGPPESEVLLPASALRRASWRPAPDPNDMQQIIQKIESKPETKTFFTILASFTNCASFHYWISFFRRFHYFNLDTNCPYFQWKFSIIFLASFWLSFQAQRRPAIFALIICMCRLRPERRFFLCDSHSSNTTPLRVRSHPIPTAMPCTCEQFKRCATFSSIFLPSLRSASNKMLRVRPILQQAYSSKFSILPSEINSAENWLSIAGFFCEQKRSSSF